jgi:hypothetical protein
VLRTATHTSIRYCTVTDMVSASRLLMRCATAPTYLYGAQIHSRSPPGMLLGLMKQYAASARASRGGACVPHKTMIVENANQKDTHTGGLRRKFAAGLGAGAALTWTMMSGEKNVAARCPPRITEPCYVWAARRCETMW